MSSPTLVTRKIDPDAKRFGHPERVAQDFVGRRGVFGRQQLKEPIPCQCLDRATRFRSKVASMNNDHTGRPKRGNNGWQSGRWHFASAHQKCLKTLLEKISFQALGE
jgi:hypothetical protein